MDEERFDHMIRTLFSRLPRRRVGGIAASLLAVSLGIIDDADAKKKGGNKKKKKKPVCTRDCTGKVCGFDSCDGSCGDCSQNQRCNALGQCIACTPACTGKTCGPNGCGGICGRCSAGESCSAAGACEPLSCPTGMTTCDASINHCCSSNNPVCCPDPSDGLGGGGCCPADKPVCQFYVHNPYTPSWGGDHGCCPLDLPLGCGSNNVPGPQVECCPANHRCCGVGYDQPCCPDERGCCVVGGGEFTGCGPVKTCLNGCCE